MISIYRINRSKVKIKKLLKSKYLLENKLNPKGIM